MVEYSTTNSFTRPPSLPQVAAYLIVLLSLIVFSSCLQNNISSNVSRWVCITCYYLSFLIQIISAFLSSLTDPAD